MDGVIDQKLALDDWLNFMSFLFASHSNDLDVIVFSVFEHAYKQCSDEPKGTYIVPVPLFIDAYMNQVALNKADLGIDDWSIPANAAYTSCTQVNVQNQIIYVQLGCTDGTSQSISVNIYSDNTCETRDISNGFDDSTIDVSDIQVRPRCNNTYWILNASPRTHLTTTLLTSLHSNNASLA